MASLTIRNFSDGAKDALRVRAARAGISLEAYAREILQDAARSARKPSGSDLLCLSRELFGPGKGVDLELPSRASNRDEVVFD